MPPPLRPDELPLIVLLVIVSSPSFEMPPPYPNGTVGCSQQIVAHDAVGDRYRPAAVLDASAVARAKGGSIPGAVVAHDAVHDCQYRGAVVVNAAAVASQSCP